ncbi:hypothetical protein N9766_00570 [Flavobacteriaceae bacterium]|nr:hypothetical protein [Flavobacteriaceae bacterium]
MKKLIYLFLTVLIVACSSDDEDCRREITELGFSCSGSSPNDLDCTYSITLDGNETISVNETTYYYYKELYDNEIFCWRGEQ